MHLGTKKKDELVRQVSVRGIVCTKSSTTLENHVEVLWAGVTRCLTPLPKSWRRRGRRNKGSGKPGAPGQEELWSRQMAHAELAASWGDCTPARGHAGSAHTEQAFDPAVQIPMTVGEVVAFWHSRLCHG